MEREKKAGDVWKSGLHSEITSQALNVDSRRGSERLSFHNMRQKKKEKKGTPARLRRRECVKNNTKKRH